MPLNSEVAVFQSLTNSLTTVNLQTSLKVVYSLMKYQLETDARACLYNLPSLLKYL